MKIGIFAGTFDPIHNGHIEFAKSAISEAGLDKIIIVAEKQPYRKKPHTSWDHRQAMIERATEAVVQVDHDYNFASQLAHQHTMKDIIRTALGHYGASNEYWFLVGSDVFEHMHVWKDRVEASEYGGFIVALRAGHSKQWLEAQTQNLTTQGIHIKTIVITNNSPHISSSKVRDSVHTPSTDSVISQNVAQYIQLHNLYR